jgi:hypothetical protein
MKSLAWTLLAAACAVPLAAHAQVYKWIDENGKVRYGDTPPPKAKAKLIATPSARSPASPSGAANSAKPKAAKKGPLTPAEQELEFRRRAKEAQTADAKAEKDRQDKEARRLNCENSQQTLRTLESGQRISRTDAKGERYYLDEAQLAEETARARQSVSGWCQ